MFLVFVCSGWGEAVEGKALTTNILAIFICRASLPLDILDLVVPLVSININFYLFKIIILIKF